MAEETLEQLMERFNEVSEEMQELKSIRRPRTGPPPAKYAALEKEFDELRDKIYPLMKDKPEWIKLMKEHDAATKMGALEDVDVSKEQFEFTEEYDPEGRYRELSKDSGFPAAKTLLPEDISTLDEIVVELADEPPTTPGFGGPGDDDPPPKRRGRGRPTKYSSEEQVEIIKRAIAIKKEGVKGARAIVAELQKTYPELTYQNFRTYTIKLQQQEELRSYTPRQAAAARAKARATYKQPDIRSRQVPEWERFPGEYGAVTDPSEGESIFVHGQREPGPLGSYDFEYEDLPHSLRRADDPRGVHAPSAEAAIVRSGRASLPSVRRRSAALQDVDVSKEQLEFTEEYDPEGKWRELSKGSGFPEAGPPKDWTKQRVGDLGAHSTERKEKWIKKFPEIVEILGGRDQAFQFLETHFNPGKGGKGLYFTILSGEGRGDAFIDFVDSIPDTHEWGGSRPYSVALIPDVNDPKKVNSEILYGRKDRVEAAGKLFDEPYKWKKLYEKQYGSEAINKFMEYYHRTPYVDYQLGTLLDYPKGKVRAYDQLNGYILDLLKANPTIPKDELTPKAIKLFESNAPQSPLVQVPTIKQAARARVAGAPLSAAATPAPEARVSAYREEGDAGVRNLQEILDDLVDQYHSEQLAYDGESARLNDLRDEGITGQRLQLAQNAVRQRTAGLENIFEGMAAAIRARPAAYPQMRNIPQRVKDILDHLMTRPPQRGAVSLEVLLDMLTGGSWRFANPQARKEMWRRFRGVINAWFSTGSSNVPASIVTETSVMDDLVETGNRIREDFGRLRGDLDPQVHQGYKLGAVTSEERAAIQEILKRLSVNEEFLNSMLDDPTPYLEAPISETDRLATIEETGEIEAARSEEVHAQRQRRLDQQFERGHPDYPVTPYPEQQAALDAAEATRQARLTGKKEMIPWSRGEIVPYTGVDDAVQLILHEGGGVPRIRQSTAGLLYDVAEGPPTQELLDAFEAYTRDFVRANAADWHEGFSPEAMMEEVNYRINLGRAADLGISAVPPPSPLHEHIETRPPTGDLREVPSLAAQDAADRSRLWAKLLDLRATNPAATLDDAAEALGIPRLPTPATEPPIEYGGWSEEAVRRREAKRKPLQTIKQPMGPRDISVPPAYDLPRLPTDRGRSVRARGALRPIPIGGGAYPNLEGFINHAMLHSPQGEEAVGEIVRALNAKPEIAKTLDARLKGQNLQRLVGAPMLVDWTIHLIDAAGGDILRRAIEDFTGTPEEEMTPLKTGTSEIPMLDYTIEVPQRVEDVVDVATMGIKPIREGVETVREIELAGGDVYQPRPMQGWGSKPWHVTGTDFLRWLDKEMLGPDPLRQGIKTRQEEFEEQHGTPGKYEEQLADDKLAQERWKRQWKEKTAEEARKRAALQLIPQPWNK